MARDWSEFEVEAVVADYFAMLLKELRAEKYSKTQHRHALMKTDSIPWLLEGGAA